MTETVHKRKRFQIILDAVATRGLVTVQELMQELGASSATIRRDINELSDQGHIKKVHGGAEAPVLAESSAFRPYSLDYENSSHQAAKRAIADHAVSLCAEDDSIIINGGSTTFQMVHALENRRLQVLTNSLPIAAHLFEHSDVRLQVPGGEVYRDQHIILSPFENDTIKNYSASKLFMGARSLSHSGLLETDPRLIQAEQKMLSQAKRLIVMVDSTKFNGAGSLILCKLSRIDTVITDAGISKPNREMLEDAGVEVVTVSVTGDSDKATITDFVPIR